MYICLYVRVRECHPYVDGAWTWVCIVRCVRYAIFGMFGMPYVDNHERKAILDPWARNILILKARIMFTQSAVCRLVRSITICAHLSLANNA
jgi:hypothetical protein